MADQNLILDFKKLKNLIDQKNKPSQTNNINKISTIVSNPIVKNNKQTILSSFIPNIDYAELSFADNKRVITLFWNIDIGQLLKNNIVLFRVYRTLNNQSTLLASISPKIDLKNNTNIINFNYTDTSVVFGQNYSYYITAVTNNLIESLRSEILNIDTNQSIPYAKLPFDVKAYFNNNQILLNIFKDPDDFDDKIKILRKKITEFDFIEREIIDIQNNNNLFFIDDKDIDMGVTYVYRIIVLNILGQPNPSVKEVTVKTFNKMLTQNAKTTLTIKQNDNNSILVTVNSNDDFIQIKRRCLDAHENYFKVPLQWSNNSFNVNENNGLIEFIDNNVVPGFTYQYQVLSIDQFGNLLKEIISPEFIFTQLEFAFSAPINLTLERIDNKIKLNFQNNNNIENLYFEIERKKITDFDWKKFPLTTASFILDEETTGSLVRQTFLPPFLEKGVDYIYRVRNLDLSGNFSPFNFINLSNKNINQANIINKLIIKNKERKVFPNEIILNWDNIADNYSIFKKIENGNFEKLAENVYGNQFKDLLDINFRNKVITYKLISQFETNSFENIGTIKI